MDTTVNNKIFIVRRGKKPGVYTTWEKAKEQIVDFDYPEFRPFRFTDVEKIKEYLSGKNIIDDKFFAVKRGRRIGIFNSWDVCQKQILGFDGAKFASFSTKEEALTYLGLKNDSELSKIELEQTKELSNCNQTMTAYVDGSYSPEIQNYSSAFIVIKDNKIVYEKGKKGTNSDAAIELQSLAGELAAAMMVVRYAVLNGYKKLALHYDNEDIARLIIGSATPKHSLTKQYVKFVKEQMKENNLSIEFIKVKAHNGNDWNGYVDKLARKHLGLDDLEKKELIKESQKGLLGKIKFLIEEIDFIQKNSTISLRKKYRPVYQKSKTFIEQGKLLKKDQFTELKKGYEIMKNLFFKHVGVSTKKQFLINDYENIFYSLINVLMEDKSRFSRPEINFLKRVYSQRIKRKAKFKNTEIFTIRRMSVAKNIPAS